MPTYPLVDDVMLHYSQQTTATCLKPLGALDHAFCLI